MIHAKITAALALAVATSLAAGAPQLARAQHSGAQAETLFREGKDLMARGKIAEACAAFDASQKLDPTIATLLNQAACREKNEQLATAWGLFLEAERQTRAATDSTNVAMHGTAAAKAAKLEPRLSTLTITVPPEARVGGLQVLRGGEAVEPGAWNKALPVDGGTYQITARAPGNAEWSSTVTIGNEHDVKTIEIPKLKAAALRPAHPTSPDGDGDGGSTTAAGPQRSKLPFILGGGAIALGGAALGFELWARSTYSDAKAEPDNAKQDSLWHSANTKRYVAAGFGVAGLACAGVAVWLYLRPGAESPPPQTARLQVVPVVASDSAGLLVFGRY